MNKLSKIILIAFMALITLGIFTAGFILAGPPKANAADTRLLKTPIMQADIWFKGVNNNIKAYGYYLTKDDGTTTLLVVGSDGGVIEIQI